MFDMTQCKIGDKLATRRGLVAEFTCDFESGQSPYALSLPDGTWWACRRDGRVNKGRNTPTTSQALSVILYLILQPLPKSSL